MHAKLCRNRGVGHATITEIDATVEKIPLPISEQPYDSVATSDQGIADTLGEAVQELVRS